MSHGIFVEVSCEFDPVATLRLDPVTKMPQEALFEPIVRVSTLSKVRLQQARILDPSHVQAFAFGKENLEALRYALASGAMRAICFSWEKSSPLEAYGAHIAKWFLQQEPMLIIADVFAGPLAYYLGLPHAASLSDLHMHRESYRLFCKRHREKGVVEEMSIRLPAAVRLWSEDASYPYVSTARLLQAKLEQVEMIDLEMPSPNISLKEGELKLARKRTRTNEVMSAQQATGMNRLQALMGGNVGKSPTVKPILPKAQEEKNTPEELAETFVRYVFHHSLFH